MRLGKKTLIVLAALLSVFALSTATAGAENGGAAATPPPADLDGAYIGNQPPPEVLNNSLEAAAPQVAGIADERAATEAASAAAEPAALAFTGGDTAAIAAIGAVALLAGLVLITARRRGATA